MGSEAWQTIRRLLRSPSFFVPAALTVAVGVAPTLLLAVAGHAVLPPLPLAEPETLVVLRRSNAWGDRFPMSYPKYELLRDESRTLDVMAHGYSSMTVSGEGDDAKLKVEAVSPNVFRALRVEPMRGRVFRDDENGVPLGHPVAMISERLWRSRFSSRPDILGRAMTLNGVPFTIVGVVPAGFRGLSPALSRRNHTRPMEVWIPVVMAPLGFDPRVRTASWIRGGSPHAQWLQCAARIRSGFTKEDVDRELAVLTARLHARWPAHDGEGVADERIVAWRAQEFAVDPTLAGGLARLRWAGALVLLLACLNVAHMLVARGVDRQGDLALRLSLGASPYRAAAEPLVEAAWVTVTGLGGAALFTWWIVGTIVALPAAGAEALLGTRLDAPLSVRALLPTAGLLLVLVTAACALAPAWVRRRTSVSALLNGHQGFASGPGFRSLAVWRPRGFVAAVQVALAIGLVVPTGLLVRSLQNVLARPTGFDARNALAAEFALHSPNDRPGDARSFLDDVDARLRESGIAAWGYADCLPLSGACLGTTVRAEGAAAEISATVHRVSAGTFRGLGIPLLRGRDFQGGDREGSPPAVIVSEEAARRLGGHVLGRRITVGGFVSDAEVVGVVADTHYADLVAPIVPAVYLSFAQRPSPQGFLVVRAGPGTTWSPSALRDRLGFAGPLTVRTLEDRVAASVAQVRIATLLATVAAAMAVVLAGIGVFGLLAWLVSRTRQEIGVRIALGATASDVSRLTLRTALSFSLAGAVVGLVAGVSSASHLRHVLFQVEPWDLVNLSGTTALAVLLGIGSALWPARRAARTDPVATLRRY